MLIFPYDTTAKILSSKNFSTSNSDIDCTKRIMEQKSWPHYYILVIKIDNPQN